MLADRLAHNIPVEGAGTVHGDGDAPLLLKKIDGVDREETSVPLGTLEGLVSAALSRKLR